MVFNYNSYVKVVILGNLCGGPFQDPPKARTPSRPSLSAYPRERRNVYLDTPVFFEKCAYMRTGAGRGRRRAAQEQRREQFRGANIGNRVHRLPRPALPVRGAPHPGEVRGGADEERIFSYVAALARLPRPALPDFESFLVKCLKFNLKVTYTTSPMYSLTGVAYGVARTHSGFVDPSSLITILT